MTEWRTIPGFSNYEVSTDGKVRSYWKKKPKILKQQANHRGGHMAVRLTPDGGKQCTRFVHSLVLTAFVGPRPDGMYALHKDDDPTNNTLDNLYWGTPSENIRQSVKRGRHHTRKLSDADVRFIRTSPLSTLKLAPILGVHQTTIANARRGKTHHDCD